MRTVESLLAAWRGAGRVVVLTGAGLSTPSGIPDFRSPGGRWERYQPVAYPDFLGSEAARERYWRYKGETWQVIRAAAPNAAHVALAELARASRIELLVTQNVDGLHERSDFPPERLVNIHGSDAEVECIGCHRREPRAVAQEAWEAGTAVPRSAECDLFVAAGTSLVVGPINQMMPAARAAGARTAILTASETPFDEVADFRLREPVEDVLPAVRERVLARV
jgi:NAD-dependent deacetylase